MIGTMAALLGAWCYRAIDVVSWVEISRYLLGRGDDSGVRAGDSDVGFAGCGARGRGRRGGRGLHCTAQMHLDAVSDMLVRFAGLRGRGLECGERCLGEKVLQLLMLMLMLQSREIGRYCRSVESRCKTHALHGAREGVDTASLALIPDGTDSDANTTTDTVDARDLAGVALVELRDALPRAGGRGGRGV